MSSPLPPSPPHRPPLVEAWLKIFRYFHVIRYQVYAGLRAEIARTYIGVLWWILEPTLTGVIMYLVFSQLFVNRAPDFLPFLLIGTFAYQWFSSSVTMAANSIVIKSSIMQQVYLPKILFPIVAVLNASWKFLFSFGILILLVMIFHHPINAAYLALPVVLAVNLLLNLAVGIPLSAWIPYFRDGIAVINAVLMLVMYISGIFYRPEQVPEKLRPLFENNPLVVLFASYRGILLDGTWPDWHRLGLVAVVFAVIFLLGMMLLNKLDLSLPKVSA